MNRIRKTLLCTVLVLSVATAFAGCSGGGEEADSDKTYTLRYSVMEAPGTPMGEMAGRIVERLKEESGGKLILEPYYAGSLGDYSQIYEEVQMGSVDVTSQSIPTQFDGRLNITNIPYSVTSYEQAKSIWLDKGFGFNVLDGILDDQGIKLLSPVISGFMGIGGTNMGDPKDILDPTKKKNCLIRVPVMDTYIAMGEAMGFRTTTLPYGDLYTALQSGVADGWMGGSAYLSWTSFKDVITEYIDARYVNEIMGSYMNKATFENLPEEYQELITTVFLEEGAKCSDELNEIMDTTMDQMEQYGIKVTRPTAAELEPMAQHFRETVWPLYEEMLGKELMDQYAEALNENK